MASVKVNTMLRPSEVTKARRALKAGRTLARLAGVWLAFASTASAQSFTPQNDTQCTTDDMNRLAGIVWQISACRKVNAGPSDCKTPGDFSPSGTATLVDRRGYFATAAHNFKDVKNNRPFGTVTIYGATAKDEGRLPANQALLLHQPLIVLTNKKDDKIRLLFAREVAFSYEMNGADISLLKVIGDHAELQSASGNSVNYTFYDQFGNVNSEYGNYKRAVETILKSETDSIPTLAKVRNAVFKNLSYPAASSKTPTNNTLVQTQTAQDLIERGHPRPSCRAGKTPDEPENQLQPMRRSVRIQHDSEPGMSGSALLLASGGRPEIVGVLCGATGCTEFNEIQVARLENSNVSEYTTLEQRPVWSVMMMIPPDERLRPLLPNAKATGECAGRQGEVAIECVLREGELFKKLDEGDFRGLDLIHFARTVASPKFQSQEYFIEKPGAGYELREGALKGLHNFMEAEFNEQINESNNDNSSSRLSALRILLARNGPDTMKGRFDALGLVKESTALQKAIEAWGDTKRSNLQRAMRVAANSAEVNERRFAAEGLAMRLTGRLIHARSAFEIALSQVPSAAAPLHPLTADQLRAGSDRYEAAFTADIVSRLRVGDQEFFAALSDEVAASAALRPPKEIWAPYSQASPEAFIGGALGDYAFVRLLLESQAGERRKPGAPSPLDLALEALDYNPAAPMALSVLGEYYSARQDAAAATRFQAFALEQARAAHERAKAKGAGPDTLSSLAANIAIISTNPALSGVDATLAVYFAEQVTDDWLRERMLALKRSIGEQAQ